MNIVVGSTNPTKIKAVKAAFPLVWPDQDFTIKGVKTSSHVRSQPMSDQETIKGAITRAQKVISISSTEYGVGIEGGLDKINNNWFSCGWVAVINQQNLIGLASSERIMLPQQLIDLVLAGKELGEADDLIFNIDRSSQHQGNFGLMTNDATTRTKAYTHAIICASSRFIHPQLF